MVICPTKSNLQGEMQIRHVCVGKNGKRSLDDRIHNVHQIYLNNEIVIRKSVPAAINAQILLELGYSSKKLCLPDLGTIDMQVLMIDTRLSMTCLHLLATDSCLSGSVSYSA